MNQDNYKKPAYPEPTSEDGWPTTTNTGFTKLEAASIQIATGLLNLDPSWETMFSTPLDEPKKGSKFSQAKLARNAVAIAKAVLDECAKEQQDEQT